MLRVCCYYCPVAASPSHAPHAAPASAYWPGSAAVGSDAPSASALSNRRYNRIDGSACGTVCCKNNREQRHEGKDPEKRGD